MPAFLRLFHQHLVQREKYFRFRCALTRQVQIVGDHLEELLRVDAGVEQESELDVLRFQVIAQAFEHRRFARAHLARQDDKSLTRLYAIYQIG